MHAVSVRPGYLNYTLRGEYEIYLANRVLNSFSLNMTVISMFPISHSYSWLANNHPPQLVVGHTLHKQTFASIRFQKNDCSEIYVCEDSPDHKPGVYEEPKKKSEIFSPPEKCSLRFNR